MSIPVGVTPTFTLTFDDDNLDLTATDHVYVTFKSGLTKITKSDAQLTVAAKQIDVALTQAETLSFMPASYIPNPPLVEIQANWTYSNGDRAASDIVKYPFGKQLLDKVVN